MNCPKCKTHMREVRDGMSQLSGLLRHSGDRSSAINGYSCWCCGTWIESDAEVLLPLAAEMIIGANSKQTGLRQLVKSNLQTILHWRNQGKTYDQIASKLGIERSPALICKYLRQFEESAA